MTVLLTIATLLLCIPVPPQNQLLSGQQNSVANQEKSNQSNCAVACKSSCGNKQASKNESQAPNKNRDTLDTIYKVSSPIVAIVGVGTLVLVWRQIRAIHNSERAWLLVTGGTVERSTHGMHARFDLKNWGKSPARITSGFIKTCTIKDLKELGERLKAAPGTDCNDIDGRPIAPTETAILQLSSRASSEEDTLISKGKLTLIFLARITYEDIFSRKHVTQICYCYVPPDFPARLNGTVEYFGGNEFNKAT
jgi:hypothetical protein